ncbi:MULTISPECIES: histidine phosphatase family protein [Staphylococcus]|uniref:histidine phosphatase family protein n=1 Tax=unclassified Staphylococcus TaxID=91994 RepID=UPI0008AA1A58|nr:MULTISPECIES: histidine phosphatase family protein [unclassified Staphylococcus]OHR83297.1 phosphoglycerate mutase [Staphylococcus sp. HMSC34C02]
MVKTLYLMRHGQTMFNLRGKVQGASDSPLTNLGIAQAKQAGQYFEAHQITFGNLYSSSSERACDTLECVVPDQDYKRLKGLKEWHFGILEGESNDLLNSNYDVEDAFGDRLVVFDGESKEEVEARFIGTLTEIMRTTDSDTNLVVSHGTTLDVFLRKVIGDTAATQYFIGNCHILKFTYDNNVFQFIEKIDPENGDISKHEN